MYEALQTQKSLTGSHIFILKPGAGRAPFPELAKSTVELFGKLSHSR